MLTIDTGAFGYCTEVALVVVMMVMVVMISTYTSSEPMSYLASKKRRTCTASYCMTAFTANPGIFQPLKAFIGARILVEFEVELLLFLLMTGDMLK